MTEGSTPTIVIGKIVGAHRGLRVLYDTKWSLYKLGRTAKLSIEKSDRVCQDKQ